MISQVFYVSVLLAMLAGFLVGTYVERVLRKRAIAEYAEKASMRVAGPARAALLSLAKECRQ